MSNLEIMLWLCYASKKLHWKFSKKFDLYAIANVKFVNLLKEFANTLSINTLNAFFLIVKQTNNIWYLKVIKPKHNHFFTFFEIHSMLRNAVLIFFIQNEIHRQLTIQIASIKMLSNFRFVDSIIDVDDNYENSQSINSLLKFRNIYNFKTQKRREILKSLIFIQILIRELKKNNDWIYVLQKNFIDHIIHFFFHQD